MLDSRYKRAFAKIKTTGRKAFIPFNLLGYPNAERCLQSAKLMIESGATALEFGIAFSDPLADGPVIQQAATSVIESGFSFSDALALLSEIRNLDSNIPIGLLVYFNTVLSQGVESFFQQAAAAGVDGVLVVDLPPESYAPIESIVRKSGLDSIFLISPLTTLERLGVINRYASGFLYAVSRLGITGTDERYDMQLSQLLSMARSESDLPVCVGFGVSNAAAAQKIFSAGADGVITGSRIVEILNADNSIDCGSLRAFLRTMVEAEQPLSAKK
ncbi:MAG: tryptophan synthase subunit alpha [Candidatus Obscuribacterales bacterium]|nr:tryptophan synthase subunit alpha [Candidatus Obscuribacterales bacterium]